jgi:hypothetical protein
MWDDIKARINNAFGRHNQGIKNSAKRTFDLGMEGIITKSNAINNLMVQYDRAQGSPLKEQIVVYIKEIWRRP